MRGKERSLKDAIGNYMDNTRLRSKYNEVLLTEKWETLVGKPIAEHTRSIAIRNHDLILTIDSAPLKNELRQLQEKVLELVNGFLGAGTVSELIVR